MMRFIHVAVAVLSLLSVSQSTPVTSCDSLIQPFENSGREQLLGKWVHVAESRNNPGVEELTKRFQESVWLKFTAANESNDVNVMASAKMFGFCATVTFKMSLEKNTLQPSKHGLEQETEEINEVKAGMDTDPIRENPESGNKGRERVIAETAGEAEPVKVIKLLKTGCSDCLLLQPPEIDNMMGGKQLVFKGLLLLSKRSTVTAAELYEFKKQSKCLNLLEPFSLNPEGDVCPELPSQDMDNTDVPRLFVNGQETDFEIFLMNVTSSLGGPEEFMKIVQRTILKDN